ncbi:MAG TPA: hypothetical protein VIX63_16755 [Vicinamibacterales bacterium]
MDRFQVPESVRATLGVEASEGLTEMFGGYQEIATERFERRLEQEIGGLRLEMHQGFAGMRTEMAQLETRLIKWSFAFWIGGVAVQSALITGLISYLNR